MNNLLALLNGSENGLLDGAIVAVVSIILVFVLLALIIGITYAVSLIINKYVKEEKKEVEEETSALNKSVEIKDEDAMVAVLVASIDYRAKTKKDFKVISVKEIK